MTEWHGGIASDFTSYYSIDAACVTPEYRYSQPCCREGGDPILLQPEENELIRLIDLEGIEQEAAAERLGVSRKTAWRDLHEARRKIADSLVHGKGITMAGCTRPAEGRCPKCPRDEPGRT